MQVPTYTRQTAMTTATAATPFSVRADVGGLTQGIAAEIGFYKEVEATGSQIFQTFLSQQRASDLATAEAEAASRTADAKREAQTKGKGALKYFTERARQIQKSVGSSISDPITRYRFNAKVAPVLSAASSEVKDFEWKQTIAANTNSMYQKAGVLQQQFIDARLSGNRAAEHRVLGDIMGLHNAEMPWLSTPGLFYDGADKGWIDLKTARTATNSWLSDAVRAEIRRDINTDPGNALNKLRTPGTYRIRGTIAGDPVSIGIDEEDRATFIERAENEQRQRENEKATERRRVEAAAEKDRTKRHNNTFSAFVAQVLAARNGEGSLPTEQDINEAIKADMLDGKLADRLINIVNNREASATHPEIKIGFQNRISAAENESQLEDIRAEVSKEVGWGGTLQTADAMQLLKIIDQKLGSDARYQTWDRYRKNINLIFTGNDNGIFTQFGAGTEKKRQQLAEALQAFDKLTLGTTEEESVTPEEAFQQIRMSFFSKDLMQNRIPLNPLIWPTEKQFKDEDIKPVNQNQTDRYTIEALQIAKKNINKAYRANVIPLGIYRFNMNLIAGYERDIALRDRMKGTPQENAARTDNAQNVNDPVSPKTAGPN